MVAEGVAGALLVPKARLSFGDRAYEDFAASSLLESKLTRLLPVAPIDCLGVYANRAVTLAPAKIFPTGNQAALAGARQNVATSSLAPKSHRLSQLIVPWYRAFEECLTVGVDDPTEHVVDGASLCWGRRLIRSFTATSERKDDG